MAAVAGLVYPRRWGEKSVLTDEQRLLTRLLRDYDHNTRPVFNASHAVVVKLGITLNQIFDLVCHGYRCTSVAQKLSLTERCWSTRIV